jgi:hypothetical protein
MRDLITTTTKDLPSDAKTRIALCLALLKLRASDLGMAISADERISEHDAAALLEVHPDTMRRWRAEGCGPAEYKLSVGRSRYSYRLADLASHVEKKRHETG